MKSMAMNRNFIFRLTICGVLLFLSGCAEIRLNALPAPSPTDKLRVFVLPVSGNLPRGTWGVAHAEFAKTSYLVTGKMLSEKGIYAVVSPEEVQRVTGGEDTSGWQWEKDGWALARRAGRALHADYALILMRGHSGFFYAKMVMINLATGRQYEKFDHVQNMREPGMQSREHARVFRECYQEIFRQAKGDMLATAIRKGRLAPQKSGLPAHEVERREPEEKPAASVAAKPEPPKTATPVPVTSRPASAAGEIVRKGPEGRPAGPAGMKPEPPKAAAVDRMPQRAAGAGGSELQRTIPPAGPAVRQAVKPGEGQKVPAKQRMIVYDLQATAQLNVVALILSEALREELFSLGGFDLINREDMEQAVQEMKLQQSGLIDDQQALQIGKWMAANQTVTGNLGIIGDALILQTKRTDLQTMVILSRGSARAGVGKEEELLEALPALARKLVVR